MYKKVIPVEKFSQGSQGLQVLQRSQGTQGSQGSRQQKIIGSFNNIINSIKNIQDVYVNNYLTKVNDINDKINEKIKSRCDLLKNNIPKYKNDLGCNNIYNIITTLENINKINNNIYISDLIIYLGNICNVTNVPTNVPII